MPLTKEKSGRGGIAVGKQTALNHLGSFQKALVNIDPQYARFLSLKTLQLNLGDVCNLRCFHCHINASPRGTRLMTKDVMDKIILFLYRISYSAWTLPGGSPEMNPHFRYLIEKTKGLTEKRIVRTNLTIIRERGMEWLPEFFRDQRITLVASLPCFTEEEVDRQRGKVVYARCVSVLKELNGLGYGKELELNLAYNPGGDFLPGAGADLEVEYRRELFDRQGIFFNHLFVLTNSPAGRFRDFLDGEGARKPYYRLLETNFNQNAASNIMCRTLISVNWSGDLFSCDFNHALNIPIRDKRGNVLTVKDLGEVSKPGREIDFGRHCFSCTSGEGSSCTGTLIGSR